MFLPKLNNEVGQGSPEFKRHQDRMKSLNAMMMIIFDRDEVVSPCESQQFGVYEAKDDKGKRKVVKMEDTDWYKQDVLGLKTLQDTNRLFTHHINAGHVQYTQDDVMNKFIPFLRK